MSHLAGHVFHPLFCPFAALRSRIPTLRQVIDWTCTVLPVKRWE